MMCRKTAGLVLVMVISLLFTSCTLLRVELGPTQDPLTERTVSGSGSDKVLLVDISGVIMSGDSGLINLPLLKGEDMVQRLAEELNKAREDKHIKALLVRIDSPGGSVSASDSPVSPHRILSTGYRGQSGGLHDGCGRFRRVLCGPGRG